MRRWRSLFPLTFHWPNQNLSMLVFKLPVVLCMWRCDFHNVNAQWTLELIELCKNAKSAAENSKKKWIKLCEMRKVNRFESNQSTFFLFRGRWKDQTNATIVLKWNMQRMEFEKSQSTQISPFLNEWKILMRSVDVWWEQWGKNEVERQTMTMMRKWKHFDHSSSLHHLTSSRSRSEPHPPNAK